VAACIVHALFPVLCTAPYYCGDKNNKKINNKVNMIYGKVYFCTLTMKIISKQPSGLQKTVRATGKGTGSPAPVTAGLSEIQIFKTAK
jgi:hypothetical protein